MIAACCPDREQLVALDSGLLPEDEAYRLGVHLDDCTTCRAILETIVSQDPVAVALRRSRWVAGGETFATGRVAVSPADARAEQAARGQQAGAPLPLESFIGQLVESGLMLANEIEAFVNALPNERQPRDGAELGDALVCDGKLTDYQARMVSAGRGRSLVLGHYVIRDKLGQGGMGVVYEAVHRHLARTVALKVLSPRFSSQPEFVRRFQREVRAAARLAHPNIVRALDAELAGARQFLVMEFVAGIDLAALVKRRGPLPVDQALECVLQAARGLEYAHG